MRLKDGDVLLRLMTVADGPALLRFALGLPAHDLLFLRRDITKKEGHRRLGRRHRARQRHQRARAGR